MALDSRQKRAAAIGVGRAWYRNPHPDSLTEAQRLSIGGAYPVASLTVQPLETRQQRQAVIGVARPWYRTVHPSNMDAPQRAAVALTYPVTVFEAPPAATGRPVNPLNHPFRGVFGGPIG